MKIIIKSLSKMYGNKQALNSIDLTIQDEMFGLLGQNGAGKTTLMRIMTTLLMQDSGEVWFDDIPIKDKKEIRKIVGYLPQEFSLYPNFTVYEAMDYLALLSSVKESMVRKRLIFELSEKVNLTDALQKKVKELSGGMKRRLGIAQALINDPKVLIVDEPTAGLDPEERIRFRNMLSEFSVGRNVIFSTHIVSDIEYSCKNLAILKTGQILYQGSTQDLLKQAEGCVWNVLMNKKEWDNNPEAAGVDATTIQSIQQEGELVRLRVIAANRPTPTATLGEVNMEDAYMYMVRGKC